MAGAAAATGIVAALATLTVGLGAVGGATVHGQRLAAAADGAALAAADAASGAVDGTPCDRAAEIASRHGAEVVSCEVDGLIATVRVGALFGPIPVSATARAGPPPDQAVVDGR